MDTITKLENLTPNALDLISAVADSGIEDATNNDQDSRGAYIEHDRFGCKPYDTKVIDELAKSGLVELHDDSGAGCAFMNITDNDIFVALNTVGVISDGELDIVMTQ